MLHIMHKITRIIRRLPKLKLILSPIFLVLINRAACWYYGKLGGSRTFVFRDKTYHYFYHTYNPTWRNERCVETPIIWSIVKRSKEANILEVGNVLSHYFDTNHDVLDKYERAPGVINEDVVEFKSNKRYDLIVSISTLEHVGW